eukprot:1196191-Prorocentrum_minimum.AAC.3
MGMGGGCGRFVSVAAAPLYFFLCGPPGCGCPPLVTAAAIHTTRSFSQSLSRSLSCVARSCGRAGRCIQR